MTREEVAVKFNTHAGTIFIRHVAEGADIVLYTCHKEGMYQPVALLGMHLLFIPLLRISGLAGITEDESGHDPFASGHSENVRGK